MASKSAVELAGDSRLADSGNAGLQNGREGTEGQTVGLATDSELEVFKPWGLVDGIRLKLFSEALIARMRCAKSPNFRVASVFVEVYDLVGHASGGFPGTW